MDERESVLYFANNHKEHRVWLMTLPIALLPRSKASHRFLEDREGAFCPAGETACFCFFLFQAGFKPQLKSGLLLVLI